MYLTVRVKQKKKEQTEAQTQEDTTWNEVRDVSTDQEYRPNHIAQTARTSQLDLSWVWREELKTNTENEFVLKIRKNADEYTHSWVPREELANIIEHEFTLHFFQDRWKNTLQSSWLDTTVGMRVDKLAATCHSCISTPKK